MVSRRGGFLWSLVDGRLIIASGSLVQGTIIGRVDRRDYRCKIEVELVALHAIRVIHSWELA
jgi:hypothetical protein